MTVIFPNDVWVTPVHMKFGSRRQCAGYMAHLQIAGEDSWRLYCSGLFTFYEEAEYFAERVKEKGEVDLTKWTFLCEVV